MSGQIFGVGVPNNLKIFVICSNSFLPWTMQIELELETCNGKSGCIPGNSGSFRIISANMHPTDHMSVQNETINFLSPSLFFSFLFFHLFNLVHIDTLLSPTKVRETDTIRLRLWTEKFRKNRFSLYCNLANSKKLRSASYLVVYSLRGLPYSLASPKSATFKTPLLPIKRFEHFKSRWITH